jgi:hypothetical protein
MINMKCPSCGRENPYLTGNFCTFCGANFTEASNFVANFTEASNCLNDSAMGTLSMYKNAKSWEVEPSYMAKLNTMKDQFFTSYKAIYSELIESAQRNEETQIINERIRIKRETRAKDIQFIITAINAAFNKIHNEIDEVFRQDVPAFFTELPIDCTSYENFNYKIQNLSCIFEVNIRNLRTIINDSESEWKSIKIIEEWFKQEGVKDTEDIINVWKNIILLRNMPPAHPKLSQEHIEAMNFFNGGVNDFSNLWDNILDRFHSSLKAFYNVLEPML